MQHSNAQTDPHDAIVAQLRELAPKSDIPADEVPAASPALDAMPLHAAPLNDNAGDIHRLLAPRARTGRRVARGLLVVCVAAAAMTAWYSYGDAARQKLSEVVPQFLAGTPAAAQNGTADGAQDTASQDTASSQSTASSQDAAPVAVPQSASDAAPAQAASTATPETVSPPQPAVPTAAQGTEPPQAQPAIPPELAQSIESMGREIASLRHELEQLKTRQEQLGREIVKAAEHEARQKPAAEASKRTPRPRRSSAAPAAPRTGASHAPSSREAQQPYPQSYPQPAPQREAYIPPPPPRLPPPPGDSNVPRPPMPLR